MTNELYPSSNTVKIVVANELYKLPADRFIEDLSQKIARWAPNILAVNEVDSRNALLQDFATKHQYALLHFWDQPGADGDSALLLSKWRYSILDSGLEPLHGEPPGKPSKRYAVWAIVEDLATGLPFRIIAEHTLAAVERGNKLNPIPRTKYYVEGIKHNLVLDRRLRKRTIELTGDPGIGLCLGDMNWHGGPGSWINKMMGVWYQSSFQALGMPAHGDLGKRNVTFVWKRGKRFQFKKQVMFSLWSDHNGLFVEATASK